MKPGAGRIAVVNSVREIGGGEKWVARQAALWSARGWSVLVVCQPGSGLEGLAREVGCATAPVRMRHDVSAPAALRIGAALRRFAPGLILCCTERAFRLASPARRLAGSPPLVYRNGLTGTFKNRAHNRLLLPALARIVANTEAIRAELAAFGWIPPARLAVIQNGIDPTTYAPDPEAGARIRREVGTPGDAVVAAVLARVTEEKGHLETVEAMGRLAPEHPGAELWIVGEGALRPRLEQRARALGIGSRVRFLGYRGDIPAVLQAVDVVVQASHREGLGNTLLEAMAAGLPVVASAVGGTPDVVASEETGLLVPPRDVPALAAALGELLADPVRRRRYGASGRGRVQDRFRLDREADAWLSLFGEVMAERGASE